MTHGPALGARRNGPAFAHPVERAFAKLLDKHGVPWEYEPQTFVLFGSLALLTVIVGFATRRGAEPVSEPKPQTA